MRHHRRFGQRGKQPYQCRDAFRRARRQAHHAEQGQKTGYRRGDMVLAAGNTQPDESQQTTGNVIHGTCFKRRRVVIFAPDAVVLSNKAMVKNIEKRHHCVMSVMTLGNVVQIGGGQRRIHAVQAEKGGAHRGGASGLPASRSTFLTR